MIRLVDLLADAKKQGFLYTNIPYSCGIDEAIHHIDNTYLKNDKGFNKNQLTVINKDGLIIYEIRKSPNHKKCFSLKVWR